MSDPRMAPSAVAPGNVIHYCTVFGPAGYSAPTACGRTEQPKPASDDWRLVDCPACWDKRNSDRAQRLAEDMLMCGDGNQYVFVKKAVHEELAAATRLLLVRRGPSGGGGA